MASSDTTMNLTELLQELIPLLESGEITQDAAAIRLVEEIGLHPKEARQLVSDPPEESLRDR